MTLEPPSSSPTSSTTGIDRSQIWILRPTYLKLGGNTFGARTPAGIRFQVDFQQRPIPVANNTTTIAKINRVTGASMYWDALETDLEWYADQFNSSTDTETEGGTTTKTLEVGATRLSPVLAVEVQVRLSSSRDLTITGNLIIDSSTQLSLSRRSMGTHRVGGEFQHDVTNDIIFTMEDEDRG